MKLLWFGLYVSLLSFNEATSLGNVYNFPNNKGSVFENQKTNFYIHQPRPPVYSSPPAQHSPSSFNRNNNPKNQGSGVYRNHNRGQQQTTTPNYQRRPAAVPPVYDPIYYFNRNNQGSGVYPGQYHSTAQNDNRRPTNRVQTTTAPPAYGLPFYPDHDDESKNPGSGAYPGFTGGQHHSTAQNDNKQPTSRVQTVTVGDAVFQNVYNYANNTGKIFDNEETRVYVNNNGGFTEFNNENYYNHRRTTPRPANAYQPHQSFPTTTERTYSGIVYGKKGGSRLIPGNEDENQQTSTQGAGNGYQESSNTQHESDGPALSLSLENERFEENSNFENKRGRQKTESRLHENSGNTFRNSSYSQPTTFEDADDVESEFHRQLQEELDTALKSGKVVVMHTPVGVHYYISHPINKGLPETLMPAAQNGDDGNCDCCCKCCKRKQKKNRNRSNKK